MAVRSAGTQTGSNRSASRLQSVLFRNLAVLAGSQVVTWTLSLAWTIFVPRALQPKGMGELTIATAVTGVISVIASLGIGTLLTKEIAREHARAPSLVGNALWIRVAFFVPSLLAVALYTYVAHADRELTLVMWLATAVMLLGLVIQPLQSAFQGLEQMQFIAYADILTKAVSSLAGVAMVIIGFRVVGIMGMILATNVLALLLTVWWSRGRFDIDRRIDPAVVRSLITDSLPYWTTGLVLTFYIWIDSVLLSLFTSSEVVGWYAVPTKIFNTLLFAAVIVSVVMLPRLSASFRDGANALKRTAKPAVELVLVMSFPIAVGAALVAKDLIAFVYGQAFAQSSQVLIILAFMLPPTYFNIMANQVLIAANRQVVWTKVMIAAAIINPLLNLVLIPYFQAQPEHNGALGAAYSLLATEIGMALAGLFLMPPVLDLSSWFRLFRALLATAGMALVAMATSFNLLLEIGAGAVTFVILALVLRVLSRDETALFRNVVARAVVRESSHSTTSYHGWDDISARPGGTFSR